MEQSPEPKRRNAAATRTRILAAAFEAFAEHGYAKAGIREIAKSAGVASSLLVRYFGTKAALFEEALTHGIYAHSLFTQNRENFGEQMARMIANTDDIKLTSMMVLAIADPESKAIAIKVSRRHVLEPLSEWLGPPRAYARAQQMVTLFTGIVLQMHHLADTPIQPESIKWIAQTLQDIVDAR
ncbi:MAG TPA: TetR family transcriptional regulator [Sphingobium sp.]|uniref:TetR family transcriptional regulator n=1 Tax=Sphingobium sp. TaxID=1912891 RepID=UPI002ED062F0